MRGYLHWTLLDNFEWMSGFKITFGLIAFDPTTFERTVKPSARWLGDVARGTACRRREHMTAASTGETTCPTTLESVMDAWTPIAVVAPDCSATGAGWDTAAGRRSRGQRARRAERKASGIHAGRTRQT